MKVIYLLMIFFAGSMLGAFLMRLLDSPAWGGEPRANYQTLHFPESDSNIYMTARASGLTGDHEEVRLCTKRIDFCKSSENNECIVFYTDQIFYRKENTNKLHIYAISNSVPNDQPEHLGQLDITLDKLKNYDQVKELEISYEKRGLAMIAIP